jgi:hypothetical protein
MSRKSGTDLIRFRKELAMSEMYSINLLERYARDHYADLLAEAEKARLVKVTLVKSTPRQASRVRDVQFKLRSILAVLVSHISQIM